MSMTTGLVTRDDLDLIVAFAGCTLDESPGSNWVQDAGGLPDYICRIARAVKRSGKTTSQAISIAVSRVKKWAAGVGVDNDTQAKAAAAAAEWEKLKAKSKAKSAAKDAAETVKASNILALTDYNIDVVRQAFEDRTRQARQAWRTANPGASYDDPGYPDPMYVKEVWNSFLIVQSDYGRNPDLYKIPYTVDDDANVSFADPVEVKQQYVEVDDKDTDDDTLTDDVLQKLMAACGPCPKRAVDKFLTLTPAPISAVDNLLNLVAGENGAMHPAEVMARGQALVTHGQHLCDLGQDEEGKRRIKRGKQMVAKAKTRLATMQAPHTPLMPAPIVKMSALDKVLALAASKDDSGDGKPYANTKASKYADPGYQSDGKKRYALDTAEQVRAAWSYVNQKDNAAKYKAADLTKVKAAIKAAAKDFGIQISDD